MIRAALALALAIAGAIGPDSPVCDPAIGIVTDCVQPQGEWELIGRDLGDGVDPAAPADPAAGSPAYTG